MRETRKQTSLARLTPRTITGFVASWVLALMAVNLVPALISSLQVGVGLTIAQAGNVATAMSVSSVLAMASTSLVIVKFDRPLVARIGSLLMLLGFGGSAWKLEAPWVVCGLVLAGMGCGIVVAAGTAAAATTEDPDRTTTIVYVINRFLAAILMAITPLFRNDLQTLLAVLAVLAIIGLVLSGGLPNIPTALLPGANRPRGVFVRAGIVLAATLGLWSITEEMVYSMTAVLAEDAGLSAEAAGILLSCKIIGGLLGALCAPVMLRTLGRARSLAVIVLISTIAKYMIVIASGPVMYGSAIVIWGVVYGAVITLVIGLAALMNLSGRTVVTVTTVYLFGVSLGPLVGANLLPVLSRPGFAIAVSAPSLLFGLFLYRMVKRVDFLDRPNFGPKMVAISAREA